MLALVENPYYMEDYDGRYGWNKIAVKTFVNSRYKEFIPVDLEFIDIHNIEKSCNESDTSSYR